MNQINEKYTIGVDVSKDKLDLWVLPGNKHYVIKNNVREIGAFFQPLIRKNICIQVLLEPTGGYEKALIKKLVIYGVQAYLIHPNLLISFAESKGYEAKTDKLASKQLALYLEAEGIDKLTKIDDKYIESRKLQELSSRRRQLKVIMQTELCRKDHEFFGKEIIRSHKRLIKQIQQEISKLEELIDKEIEQHEEMKSKLKLLKTFCGIGPIASSSLVLDVPELGTLNREKIAKLIGVAPLNRDSGKKKGHRHIKGGRGEVRRVLYMAALVAIRHNQHMKKIFDRHMAKGKLFKVALVAVIRKMVCILNSMVKQNKTWQDFISLSAQNA